MQIAYLQYGANCFSLLCSGGRFFWSTYHPPFIFDDQRNLLNDNLMMTELSFSALQKAALNGELSGRPLANITFALDYYFHGQNLFGYHLVNIMIHLVNGFLLFLLALQILNLPAHTGVFRSSFLTALFTALLWSSHPLHIQSATYIVQRGRRGYHRCSGRSASIYLSRFVGFSPFCRLHRPRFPGQLCRINGIGICSSQLWAIIYWRTSQCPPLAGPTRRTIPLSWSF